MHLKNYFVLNVHNNHFLLILIFIVASCNFSRREDTGSIEVIDLRKDKLGKVNLKISDISTELSYIILQYSEDIIIDNIKRIELTEDYIFILDNHKLSRFNRSGQFINSIGRNGRGPGEYSMITSFSLDKYQNKVYILDNNSKIIEYNYDGEYLGNEVRSLGATSFIIFDGYFYCSHPEVLFKYIDSSNSRISILSFTNDTILRILPMSKHAYFNASPFITFGNFYIFDERLNFNDPLDDTLFCFKDTFTIFPKFVFRKDLSNGENLLAIKNIVETNDKIYILTLSRLNEWNLFLYDKNKKITKCQNRGNGQIVGIIDDIDELAPIQLRFYSDFKLIDILYPDAPKIREFFNVEEYSNPIIRIISLS